MPPRPRFVSYYRVSTVRQGQSGLGLEAQRASVKAFLAGNTPVAEFVEIESGKRSDRPQLIAAFAACRLHRATLVVAKLDRLARNAHFLLGLKEAGIDFVAVDMPAANRLTVGIMAMVAEEEARMISARTIAALQAAKERGVRLGRPQNLTSEGRKRGSVSGCHRRQQIARQRAADLGPIIAEMTSNGTSTLAAMAKELTSRGVPAPRGGAWQATQVKRVRLLLS